MTEQANRTLVCSVLFMDIVGYSKHGVDEQVRIKRKLNRVLNEALDQVPAADRIVVDTGDGAAISFLENPESALFAALVVLDHAGEVQVRMGINLGPVTLIQDINGRDNMVGDGINTAERVMSFADARQLLVSRSFYDVIRHLSREYAELFRSREPISDKHGRAHEVYAVSEAVRVGRRVAQTHARFKEERRAAPPPAIDGAPPKMFDAGTHLVVSGFSESAVRELLRKLEAEGHRLMSPVVQVGSKWLASVSNPKLAVEAKVEELGFKRIVTGPTREAVALKLQDLVELGSTVVQAPELADGVWTAVCERV
jgi:class 3 adenylate cyclase